MNMIPKQYKQRWMSLNLPLHYVDFICYCLLDSIELELSGNNPSTPNIIILMTDGHSDSPISPWHQSYANRVNGIHMMTVGLPTQIGYDYSQLRAMASWPTSGNVWTVDSFDELNGIIGEIQRAACNGEL